MLVAFILCAGSSSRIGIPKPLLKIHGKTLLKVAYEKCKLAGFDKAVAVTGAYREFVKRECDRLGLEELYNPTFEEGMASSIRLSFERAQEMGADGLLIYPVDMPFVRTETLKKLRENFKKPIRAVSLKVKDTLYPPTLFSTDLAEKIHLLKGDTGAKRLLERSKEKKHVEVSEEEIFDIDSLWDYLRAIGRKIL